MFIWCKQNTRSGRSTTRLSPSYLRPVSFRYDTTYGRTPTIFATTSTRLGIETSFVILAFRKAGRDAIQFRVSAPLKQFITNSVIKNGSRLPNTDVAVRWGQRFMQPEIKHGVLHEVGTVSTSQIVCKNLCQNMQTSMQRHNRYIWTSSIQNFGQKCSPQGSIGAEMAQHRDTNTTKCGTLRCPHHNPNI